VLLALVFHFECLLV